MTPEDAAEIYLRYYHERRQEDAWVLEKADVAMNSNIDEAWEITRAVINRAVSDEVLAYVASGPLENLLSMYGAQVN